MKRRPKETYKQQGCEKQEGRGDKRIDKSNNGYEKQEGKGDKRRDRKTSREKRQKERKKDRSNNDKPERSG
ncbi:pre-mRNA-splicing factor CWC22 homolog, partial [Watersipora subatra]|uniref:pre-mRNA-splicing factor CWC22 homolog n=1 Tax=Watersipora subatra TaxID=2589382 RepID=UPI00355C4E7C